MQKEPPPFVWAAPDEKNILTCELVPLSHLERSLTYPSRELHYCRCCVSVSRGEILLMCCSVVLLTRLSLAASIMVFYSFLPSTHSSHQGSRCADSGSGRVVSDHNMSPDVDTLWSVPTGQEDMLLDV